MNFFKAIPDAVSVNRPLYRALLAQARSTVGILYMLPLSIDVLPACCNLVYNLVSVLGENLGWDLKRAEIIHGNATHK